MREVATWLGAPVVRPAGEERGAERRGEYEKSNGVMGREHRKRSSSTSTGNDAEGASRPAPSTERLPLARSASAEAERSRRALGQAVVLPGVGSGLNVRHG